MTEPRDPNKHGDEKAIIIRDRRKPTQYTTDNVIAREWLPILRVGDAFFFYSVYLSMANRETESSWGSLRTMAQYLQCGVDLVIRGNRLLEICELIHIETGNQHVTNEYYILDPPSLTDDLKTRILERLDDIEHQESSQNWQSWVKQVRKAIQDYQSLPDIWAQRRANKGGRPARVRPTENPACEPQTGFQKGGCGTQAGWLWDTSRVVVSHKQGGCEPQTEQEQLTSKTNTENKREGSLPDVVLWIRARCRALGIATTVLQVLLEKYKPEQLKQQLEWLPARHPRDPAGMWVRAVQENWSCPLQFDAEQSAEVWAQWEKEQDTASVNESIAEDEPADTSLVRLNQVWEQALQELEMQMTRATFDRWLRGSRVVGERDGGIVVGVRDGYAVEWLQARLSAPVHRTLAAMLGRPVTVYFEEVAC